MKKFFVLTILLLMTSASCLAMTFQGPVAIGTISSSGDNAIIIDGTTNIDATFGRASNSYIKGTAVFGGKLYLHFDGELFVNKTRQQFTPAIYNEVSFFGDRNKKNSVPHFVFEGSTKIYRIDNDANLALYLLATETGGGGSMTVIGTKSDGTWVKYFDTSDGKKNFGLNNDFYLQNFYTSGDAIIFRYSQWQTGTVRELYYNWDAANQWFGVALK